MVTQRCVRNQIGGIFECWTHLDHCQKSSISPSSEWPFVQKLCWFPNINFFLGQPVAFSKYLSFKNKLYFFKTCGLTNVCCAHTNPVPKSTAATGAWNTIRAALPAFKRAAAKGAFSSITLLVGSHLGQKGLLGNKWAISSCGSAVHAIRATIPSDIGATSSRTLSPIALFRFGKFHLASTGYSQEG